MIVQDHVAGTVRDAIVWVGRDKVQEPVDCRVRVGRGGRLLAANFAEGDEQFVIR